MNKETTKTAEHSEKESRLWFVKPFAFILFTALIAVTIVLFIPGTVSNEQKLYEQATSEENLKCIAEAMSEENKLEDEKVEKMNEEYIDISIDNSIQKDNTAESPISDQISYEFSFFNNAIVDGDKVRSECNYLDLKDYAMVLVTKDMIENRDDISKCKNIDAYKDYITTFADFSYDGVAYSLSGINTNAVLENKTLKFENNYFNVDTDFIRTEEGISLSNSICNDMMDTSAATYIDTEAHYFSYLIKNSENKILGIAFIENLFQ